MSGSRFQDVTQRFLQIIGVAIEIGANDSAPRRDVQRGTFLRNEVKKRDPLLLDVQLASDLVIRRRPAKGLLEFVLDPAYAIDVLDNVNGHTDHAALVT